ncbi:protein of unknown function [Pseudomonas flavescens]|uniref:DUF1963 domain-containing protein n=1 Tax=Phytopseudomonas flavescens TaxID=29435 RepID=A0A1G8M8U2_9GAMM|nr:DUF1963 domain-containing protein [Pseudomonas flavescens]SDI64348.1 protein of unknown function [Pseudomonas flavescens]
MAVVKEIVPADDLEHSSIMLGGASAKLTDWPVNPDGAPLVLVATLECAPLRQFLEYNAIPRAGVMYVFSTYSRSGYFLDNLTYSGDPAELDAIVSGYTLVTLANADSDIVSPSEPVPARRVTFKDTEVEAGTYPVFSMLTDTPPHGIALPLALQKEYDFVMQLYSSDFPDPFTDLFYLTDAVGCLLLKKDGSGDGLFFVHTA